MKTKIASFRIALLIACFSLSQNAVAVTPPPDGGYPGSNTAEGDQALLNLTSGSYNAAVGFLSLRNNSEGNFITAVGAATLLLNARATENTAVGAGALLSNAPSLSNGGNGNTAHGAFTLFKSISGSLNTAIGDRALFSNTTASFNTAIGGSALSSNTTGVANTAIGTNALANSASGRALMSRRRATLFALAPLAPIRSITLALSATFSVWAGSTELKCTLIRPAELAPPGLRGVLKRISSQWSVPAKRSLRSNRLRSDTKRKSIRRVLRNLALWPRTSRR